MVKNELHVIYFKNGRLFFFSQRVNSSIHQEESKEIEGEFQLGNYLAIYSVKNHSIVLVEKTQVHHCLIIYDIEEKRMRKVKTNIQGEIVQANFDEDENFCFLLNKVEGKLKKLKFPERICCEGEEFIFSPELFHEADSVAEGE